jgi:hypothetical protein
MLRSLVLVAGAPDENRRARAAVQPLGWEFANPKLGIGFSWLRGAKSSRP